MTNITQLIQGLSTIPQTIILTPVQGDKRPYRSNWQSEPPLERETIKKDIQSGRAKGFGIRLGEISGGIVAVDCDGQAAHELAEQFGGLPETVSFTSGKPGRCQYLYQIPQEYCSAVTTRKINTQVKDSDGKFVHLELRWNGTQSVLPPSVHPETGQYHWVNSFETPIAFAPHWIVEKMSNFTETENKSTTDFQSVPLVVCLSRSDRQLLDSGVGEGGRNDAGAKLARNLIGTARRLEYLGYQVEGHPRELFDQYCDRCSPPINQRERETIWKSALKDNPTSSLTDEMLENCIKAHFRPVNRSYSTNNVTMSDPPAMTTESRADYKADVSQLLEENLSDSDLEIEIQHLAEKYGKQTGEVWRLYNKISREDEKADSFEDTSQELEALLKCSKASLNLDDYLPGNLGMIGEMFRRLCLRPEIGLVQFYATVSGLLPVGTRINLYESTDYEESVGIYFAMCAEPSMRKTPGQKAVVTKPLRQLQRKADDEYKKALAFYELDLEIWKEDKSGPPPTKPNRRVFFLNSATQAGLRNLLQQEQKHGMVILHDEMAADFKNRSKSYNAGMTEDLLSYYDGTGKREALAEGLVCDFDDVLLSVLGSIQPGVVSQFLSGEDDPNGFWSRLTIVNQPVQKLVLPKRENRPAKLDLTPMLAEFYEKVANLKNLLYLRLSDEAEDRMADCINAIEDYKMEAKTQGIAAQWGKLSGKIGRFAALIHIVENLEANNPIPAEVSLNTLNKAIRLGRFLINEAISLYADNTEGNLAAHLKQILAIAQSIQSQTISARDIVMRVRALRKTSTEKIREYFEDLMNMGYGQVVGKGSRRKFHFLTQTVDKLLTNLKPPSNKDSGHSPPESVDNCCQSVDTSKSPPNKDYSQTVDIVDNFEKNLEPISHQPGFDEGNRGWVPGEDFEDFRETVNSVNNVNTSPETHTQQDLQTVDKTVVTPSTLSTNPPTDTQKLADSDTVVTPSTLSTNPPTDPSSSQADSDTVVTLSTLLSTLDQQGQSASDGKRESEWNNLPTVERGDLVSHPDDIDIDDVPAGDPLIHLPSETWWEKAGKDLVRDPDGQLYRIII